MSSIWQDQHRYLIWLKVEAAVCEELAREGLIPSQDWRDLKRRLAKLIGAGGVDANHVDAHEKVTRHDVIAFTTAVAEKIGPGSRYVHFGLTSSDVVDTSLSLLILESGKQLLTQIDELLAVLKKQSLKYRDLPTIGRSHGIFAEPTSFGLKYLGWYSEWTRNRARLQQAMEQIRFGKLSGAVGVNAHVSPQFEEKVLKHLGLKREPVSTQVIPRDRHAEFLSVIAICGASLERIAIELRHLQRSEVGEVIEGFKKGQKGSSAMPHKRNPISSENITGCARLLRSYAQAALEDVALWHERDISHSSVERVVLPDATILLDYALHRMIGVLNGLKVNREEVRANLDRAGAVVYSGHVLLAAVRAGATREQAYAWIQECALAHFEGQGSFSALLSAHSELKKYLSAKKISDLTSIKNQLKAVPSLYRLVLGRRA